MHFQFNFRNTNEVKSAPLTSRSENISQKYKNAWNSKLDNGTTMSIYFDQDLGTVQLALKPDNCIANSRNCIAEVHYVQVYLTELENQANETEMNELKSWTQQGVYKKENLGQPSISVRWVINRRIVDGNNIAKARLCAIQFEELQDFPTDSACCSRTSVRSVFKQYFNEGNRSNKYYTFAHQRRLIQTKFKNWKNVFTDWQMPVDIGTYVYERSH